MPARERQIEEVFHAALEQPTPERGAYLDRACGEDPALRAELESLLQAHQKAESFIERPALAQFPELTSDDAASSMAGRRIGAYRLVRVIATGGMGTVYEALQDHPQRTVALKLMKTGLGSHSALRRFYYESHILARLRHPGIAQVYEAGVHEEAGIIVPYFAMEFVPEARTVLQYAEAHRLNARQRLELFIRVCDAVHHGHQRGVIHRDLKPSNLLVDPAGEPKVIDFGVARATDSDITATHARTSVGQLVGTLQYMSPEQCDADPENLDTRSDVYSLGLVLYQLLSGRLPYDVTGSSISTATRIIKEEAPERLSALNRELRGDIETVVLKALEKDRERRYQSATDLAQDIQRFLNNEPIKARPPSAVYQLRKLVARHKPLFASLTVLILSLSAFAASMTVLYGRAERNRLRAEKAEASSRSETQAARDVSDYLVNLFRTLDPWMASGAEDSPAGLPVMELLEREAQTIPEKLKSQPLTQADVLLALATVYYRMEMFGRAAAAVQTALELRRGALGPDDPLLAEALERLSEILRRKGEYGAAESAVREALASHRRLGDHHLGHRFLAADGLGDLGLLACYQGRYQEAEGQFREALAMLRELRAEDDPAVQGATLNLALVLRLRGDCAAAERLSREVLQRCRQTLSPGHRMTISPVHSLANALRDQGRYLEAEACLRELLDMVRGPAGEETSDSVNLMTAIALLMKARGDLDGAEALFRQALNLRRKRWGPDHPSAGSILYYLTDLLREKDDSAGLEAVNQEFAAQRQRALALPEDHPLRSGSALHMGVMKLYQGDAVGAEALLRECVELRRKALSPEHWLTALAESVLGESLVAQNRFEEAEPLLLEGHRVMRNHLGGGDHRTLSAVRRLAELYESWGRPDQAADYRAIEAPPAQSGPRASPGAGAWPLRPRTGL